MVSFLRPLAVPKLTSVERPSTASPLIVYMNTSIVNVYNNNIVYINNRNDPYNLRLHSAVVHGLLLKGKNKLSHEQSSPEKAPTHK